MNAPPRRHTLQPNAAARSETAAAVDGLMAGQGARGHRVDPARYHVTLHFLGRFASLPSGLVEAAIAAAGRVAGPRLDLVFDRAGSLRAPQPPCVLLASQVPAGLMALWRGLGTALSRAGVPLPNRTRPFVPHVTFAHARREGMRPAAIAPVRWTVAGFALLHGSGGEAQYQVLGQWPRPLT